MNNPNEQPTPVKPKKAVRPGKQKTAHKGLKPKDRPMAIKQPNKQLTGNQWRNTPQQNTFMEAWLQPSSPTFSNAYQSALKAGYSEYYAQKLTAADTGNAWIGEYVRMAHMKPEHVIQGLQDIYSNPRSYNNAKSPADTRLKALELLAKITGILDGQQHTSITIVQPILGGASIHKHNTDVIDATPVKSEG